MSRRTMLGGACVAVLLALIVTGAQTTKQSAAPAAYGYQVVHTYPHDSRAFTQGLIYLDGYLYESTGLNGRSSVRKDQLETGKVLQQEPVAQQYFAEGLTNWGTDLLQLTWTSNVGFVYDRTTFRVKRTFLYSGEGWGLTKDATRLILSDGTSTIRFLDPQSQQEIGRIAVKDHGQPVLEINELEYVRGEIYANIWQTDRIARISPKTGEVTGWIDLSGLLTASEKGSADVLNGIAYDAEKDRLFVTGKLWPKLFEIKVVPKR